MVKRLQGGVATCAVGSVSVLRDVVPELADSESAVSICRERLAPSDVWVPALQPSVSVMPFLLMSLSVARARSRLILALSEVGRESRVFTKAYAEAWVSAHRRSLRGSKLGTVRSMTSGVGFIRFYNPFRICNVFASVLLWDSESW